ncbi:choice-of-anchor A family protein [Streptomyces sp. NPDC002506]|uniref:choice-of-anchor A family protein n=1 Tax=Streptomyces sp. NPDC002506 TaxID=3154536 RepID=UPI00331FA331
MRTPAALATVGIVASLVLAPATSATAAPQCGTDPLGTAGKYAEFVEGDATRYSDSEGAVAVGGDAHFGDGRTGQGFSVGAGLGGDDLGALPSHNSLVVGGTLSANQVVLRKGSGVYGELRGTNRPGSFAIDGPHAQGSSPVDFKREFAALRASSTAWAALQANGTAARPTNGKALLLTGSDPERNVFTLNAADLQQANRMALKVPAGSTTLVNVLGSSYDMAAAGLSGVEIWDPQSKAFVLDDYAAGSAAFKALRSKLLWNFPQATSLVKNSASWPGTILAPDAAVQLGNAKTGPGHVNGAVIARKLTSVPGAETHQMVFSGCLPAGRAPSKPLPSAAHPAPTGTALPPPATPKSSGTNGKKPSTPASPSPSATQAGSPTPTATPAPGAVEKGRLALTGGGVGPLFVTGAVATLLAGGACTAYAVIRRRASRR